MYYIYRITNLINGKTYIGQHKYKELNDYYMGSGKHLLRAQKKYGVKNFKKEILVYNVSKKEHIDLLEITFIASEREKVGLENCYNIADGGGGGSHMSEETKKKLSDAHKGKLHSEEEKIKISESNKGKHHFDKSKQKEGAAFGRLVQKLQSYVLDYNIWQEEGLTKEIAKKFGCSRTTVWRANKTKNDKDKLGAILRDIERFNDYVNEYSDSIDVTYTSLRNTLECVKSTIQALFSHLKKNLKTN